VAASQSEHHDQGKPARKPLPAWKKGLLAGAVVLMVIGGGLKAAAWMSGGGTADRTVADGGGAAAGGGATGGDGASGLTVRSLTSSGSTTTFPASTGSASGADSASAAEGGGLNEWSPVIFRLGFGFFIGFCIGYALRVFFKISLTAIGVVVLAILALQYFGLVDVDWTAMEGRWDQFTAWSKEQMSGFVGFVKGQIPSIGAAGGGLYVGFRRN